MKRIRTVAAICAVIAVTAIGLLMLGRLPFCKCGIVSLWSGDIWSNQASQQFADPYTFTHIIHGAGFYGLIWLIFRKLPLSNRLIMAVVFESAWEIIENTDYVIDRYRTTTMSLDYYGDSALNSIGDILAMIAGFALAAKLPPKVAGVGAVLLDAILVLTIRDSLLINIIMLLYPIESLRLWQLQR